MPFQYQPFLIANLKYGLELGLSPWLLPQDGFSELTNAYLSKGVLYKRNGYAEFGRLVHGVTEEVVGTGDTVEVTFMGTLAEQPLRPGDLVITDGVETFSDNGLEVLTGDAGGTGTIDYVTGIFSVTFNAAPTEVDILATYNWFPDLPVTGIFNYTAYSGAQDMLAFNTVRANRYNESTNKFEDISGADKFTGNDYEYFWMTNWLSKAFITNGKDQVQIFDGSTIADLAVDFDGDSDNDLDTAYLIFPYKDRLIFLRTTESGSQHPQRARWTAVGKYDESESTNFVDAPTHEWITGAAFIRNELCVWFERSIWLLRYTGLTKLPFRWVRVATNEGLLSKMGIMDFSNEIIGIGSTRLVGTNGDTVYNLDDKIPNLVLTMNQEAMAYAYATSVDELNQLWMSYASLKADLPDQVMVLNYDEKSFSIFNLAHMVTGYYQENNDKTWDDIEETWDEIEWAWDDRTMQAGYPRVLGGDHSGYIWQLNVGGSDNGQAIEMAVNTGRGNPFVAQGLRARLGWVDYFVTRDPGIDLTVEYFIDHETKPYLTEVINLDDGSDNDQIWIRSYVGCEADFHRIRLYNNAVNQTVIIHAVLPWFAPAGALR